MPVKTIIARTILIAFILAGVVLILLALVQLSGSVLKAVGAVALFLLGAGLFMWAVENAD